VVTASRGGSIGLLWIVMTQPQRLCFNTTAQCHWHGCRRCFPNTRDEIVYDQTREDRYLVTMERTRALRAADYHVIEKWECEDRKVREVLLKQETRNMLLSTISNQETAKGSNSFTHLRNYSCTDFSEYR